MSKIRIFSKKAFAIGEGLKRGTDEINCFVTVPSSFQDMPEKFLNDATFKLAVSCGEITVINGMATEKVVQDANATTDFEEMSEMQAFYEELKVMNKNDTFALGEKYEVKPVNNEKLGGYKKRIMEAYKVANLSPDANPDVDQEPDAE